MKAGKRIQINVLTDISSDDCTHLVQRYRSEGEPDGQISVRKPSKAADGQLFPWCVENFDGRGLQFNEGLF